MARKQVITIHSDGSVSGLERKRGQGIDLKTLGRATVERVSHIVWQETPARGWRIDFLLGPRAGTSLTSGEFTLLGKEPRRKSIFDWEDYYGTFSSDVAALFDDYDAAVEVEIAVLDADRVIGKMPCAQHIPDGRVGRDGLQALRVVSRDAQAEQVSE